MELKIYTSFNRGVILRVWWEPPKKRIKLLIVPDDLPKGAPPCNYSPMSFWRDYFDLTKHKVQPDETPRRR